jgi:hypothetical protein
MSSVAAELEAQMQCWSTDRAGRAREERKDDLEGEGEGAPMGPLCETTQLNRSRSKGSIGAQDLGDEVA